MSTATAAGTSGTATGDGTTASGRARTRWRRWRLPLAVVALVLLAGAVLVAPQPRTSGLRYGADNPAADGARALAQILGHQGVQVQTVSTRAQAVAAAGAGDTLLVVGDELLTDQDADALAASPADLVLAGFDWSLDRFVPGAMPAGGSSTPTRRSAGCDDADATAAGAVAAGRDVQVPAGSAAVVCFAPPGQSPQGQSPPGQPGGDGPQGAYLVLDGARRVSVLADAGLLRNDRLSTDGTAALVLRALGRHRHLVWLVPTATDASTTPTLSTWDLLPPAARAVTAQLGVVALLLALWRGRRLGPVVVEPLPVVVPSAETTRGRGRLYRRARAYGRAAAALRAGTAARLGARLGLPTWVTGPTLVAAVARAGGRPDAQVAALLHGPPPQDEPGLIALAADLDRLERQVHRP